MELLPKDPLALFSRRAGVIYAFCILVALVAHAYLNRIAPVACVVSLAVFALVFASFLCLAGTSGQTRTDPSNALAVLLIALAFLLDGVFVAGASAFGPVKTLDVGVMDWPWDRNDTYFWSDGHWLRTKLPKRMSKEEYQKFLSWSGNPKLTNDLNAKPGQIQISMWDRQVYSVTMKNWTPPTTIGEPPHASIRPFVELFCSLAFLVLSFVIWQKGHRKGIRYREHDPFVFLKGQLRR